MVDHYQMEVDIKKIKKFQAGLFDKIEGNRERLNKALESGTAVAFHGVYHNTINTRIKNICHVLGMDLNAEKSPRIDECLEEKKKFSERAHKLENIPHNQFRYFEGQIAELKTIEKVSLDTIEVISKDYKDVKDVLRDVLETKKQNAENHLAELVDDPQIEAKFIKACKKQIEDAKRQLKKLDSGGEKDKVEANNPMSSRSGMKVPTDSKLPEPIPFTTQEARDFYESSKTYITSEKIPEPECRFYKEENCEPCKSPNDFNECDLVKIGNQIILDKFVESIPEKYKEILKK